MPYNWFCAVYPTRHTALPSTHISTYIHVGNHIFISFMICVFKPLQAQLVYVFRFGLFRLKIFGALILAVFFSHRVPEGVSYAEQVDASCTESSNVSLAYKKVCLLGRGRRGTIVSVQALPARFAPRRWLTFGCSSTTTA